MSDLFSSWLVVDAALVIRDSRLSAHELGAEFDEAQFETDANDKLQEGAGEVELACQSKARPYSWPFSDAQWTAAFPDPAICAKRRGVQLQNANTIAKNLAVAALRSSNGSEMNLKTGEAMQSNARSMLHRLETDVEQVAALIKNAGAPRVNVGAFSMSQYRDGLKEFPRDPYPLIPDHLRS